MTVLLTFSILVLIFAICYRIIKLEKHSAEVVKTFLYQKFGDLEGTPLIIGHRGGHFEAPENTLVAIRTAKENGASAVELDLAFTEDGYSVILHDDTVDRTTNGSGEVSNKRFYELRQLDATYKRKTLRYASGKNGMAEFEQIPTLKEVVVLCRDLGMKIILDVKANPVATANVVSSLSNEIPGLEKFMLITSFFPPVLYMVKRKCPEFLTALIWRHDYCNLTINGKKYFTGLTHYLMCLIDIIGNFSVHSWLPDFLGLDAVSMNKEHLSRRYVNQWRAKGIEVMSWTVNNPLEKEFHLKNLRIPVITDSLLNSEKCPEQEM